MTTTSTPTGAALDRAPRATARGAVPWVTVLSLAVVLSYADGFWVTSLRGAVGAVGRGQGPFTTWWHESTVAVPLYACAVLAALGLAWRWSGRRPGRQPALLPTALLVVGAATLVGVGLMAAGAAYDVHVQTGQLDMMGSMRGDCRPDCLERLAHDTFWLQVRATALGAGLLLVTNLGVVAWVTMLRGGRLDAVAGPRGGAVRPDRGVDRGVDRGAPWASGTEAGVRWLLAATLVASAAIHVAVVPEHLEEWEAAGLFFVALTVVQAAAAVAVVLRPDRRVLLLVVVTSVGPLVVWFWSRVWGLPLGPEPGVPEAVGVPDVAAGLLELASVVLAVGLLRGALSLASRVGGPSHGGRLALLAVVALLAVGVAATQDGWFDVVQGAVSADSGMDSR